MEDIEVEKEEIFDPLKGAVDYLDKILLKKEIISDALDSEDYETAWQEFENLIDGIETLNNLLYSIEGILDLDYSQLEYQGEKLDNYINHLNDFLSNKLITAIEDKDYLRISDLINYELEIHIKEYKKVFNFLLEYLNNNN
ncbi:hypothetical protein [Halanaerobacter jeridensis]|uniref:Uncharacterized protein n=1 Tax=Halanaerobacter jeridensis TaxID=706427 RepID=A0A938XXI5_9FIRM|nr:hypothetical protein [Halanaerobacter jeridensis]MBM7557462.1 hypothetical protein [Halanaerobacter jeridensis]